MKMRQSTGLVNRTLMHKFNTAIALVQLRELHRLGGRFTWTNKQECPTQVALDRILVSGSWESLFPLSLSHSLTRVGSDHNPIIVDLGEKHRCRDNSAWNPPGLHKFTLKIWFYRSGLLEEERPFFTYGNSSNII